MALNNGIHISRRWWHQSINTGTYQTALVFKELIRITTILKFSSVASERFTGSKNVPKTEICEFLEKRFNFENPSTQTIKLAQSVKISEAITFCCTF